MLLLHFMWDGWSGAHPTIMTKKARTAKGKDEEAMIWEAYRNFPFWLSGIL